MVDSGNPFEYLKIFYNLEFAVAVALVFLQAFFYEGLIAFRSVYEKRLKVIANGKKRLSNVITESALFALSNLYSLYLMMIFMTYNGFLCFSLVLGAFNGHLFFTVWVVDGQLEERPRSCCS